MFEKHNVTLTTYEGQRPQNCRIHGNYTANWNWDLKTYISYAEIRLFEGERPVGLIEFDAHRNVTLDKFGSIETRLGPMIDRLFTGT